MNPQPSVALDSALDLSKLLTTGSVLQINEDYNDTENMFESEKNLYKYSDFIGQPVKSFKTLSKQLVNIDATGFVKKKVLEEGGGLPLHKGCTVYIAFSGYWENESEPFDIKKPEKPIMVDLNDNGLLPGLQMAIETMLVGEMSVFLLSYEVMYGKLGIPPRVKPESDCVFYIKLMKSILTSKNGKLDFSEANIFSRVFHEVKLLYDSGVTLYKSNNFKVATQLFRKAVYMLHNCRLANENEEKIQEKMLKKLYVNLAICYNSSRQPLKACISCNELNRLGSLWNNGKVLYQNAKALRMIGQFDAAEKRLIRARKLCPDSEEIKAEFQLLEKTRESCNQSKLIVAISSEYSVELISEEFKHEVDNLLRNFKENDDLCKLTLPDGLNTAEIKYIKEACIRDNLFLNKIKTDYALDKDRSVTNSDNLENNNIRVISD